MIVKHGRSSERKTIGKKSKLPPLCLQLNSESSRGNMTQRELPVLYDLQSFNSIPFHLATV